MIHAFRVYGEVRGQGRPKVDFLRRRVYKPKKDKVAEAKIKSEFINSGGQHFGNKPLLMLVVSHRALPKSRPKSVQWEHDSMKPDASNILKLVEDALNGIAYDDDSQIVCAIPLKMPRERHELGDFTDILITDEFNENDLLQKFLDMIYKGE